MSHEDLSGKPDQPVLTSSTPDGVRKLEAARTNQDLEWRHADQAIAGILRAARRQPSFVEEAERTGVTRLMSDLNNPWSVNFPAGDAKYTLAHDGVWRPSKHYETQRVILDRWFNGEVNRALICTIQGMKHDESEPIHLGPKEELTVGSSEPVTGVDALLGLTDAFPELGLVWS